MQNTSAIEPQRITIRPTQTDEAALNAIGEHLRHRRRGWVSRTDAVRFAIHTAEDAIKNQTAGARAP